MHLAQADSAILNRFRRALDEAYGSKLERIVLLGSRARGDARPDSDYDIAVFIHGLQDFWHESGRLVDIGVVFLYDTGLMSELRSDGIDL
jgi:uncharacterized protein